MRSARSWEATRTTAPATRSPTASRRRPARRRSKRRPAPGAQPPRDTPATPQEAPAEPSEDPMTGSTYTALAPDAEPAADAVERVRETLARSVEVKGRFFAQHAAEVARAASVIAESFRAG